MENIITANADGTRTARYYAAVLGKTGRVELILVTRVMRGTAKLSSTDALTGHSFKSYRVAMSVVGILNCGMIR